MKMKGINPFEQHADKIFLGVVGTVLLGVVGMQLLTSPNQVQVGKGGKMVPPEEAFKPVEDEARRLRASVDALEPKLPEVPDVTLLSEFDKRLGERVSPADRMFAMGRRSVLGASGSDLGAGSGSYAAVAVPTPSNPIAFAFRSTIDPIETLRWPELKKIVPAEQPLDKAAVSIEAVFDGAALKSALSTDPDGPAVAVPKNWWLDRTAVIGVEVERQRLNADGTWGEAEKVSSMPGRPALLDQWTTEVQSLTQAEALVSRAQEFAEGVQRPAYYTTIAGPQWMEPSKAAERAAALEGVDPRNIQAMRDRRSALETEIADLQQKIQSAPPEPERGTGTGGGRTGGGRTGAGGERDEGGGGAIGGGKGGARSGGGGAGGGKGGGGGMMGGGGGASGIPGGSGGQTERRQPQLSRKALERRLADAERALVRVTDELAKLDPSVKSAAQAAATQTQAATGVPTRTDLLDNAKVPLIAHDVFVREGETYRYRTRVVVNNPYFGRGQFLKNQEELAKDSLIRSAWSDWSEPVSVDRSEYFFVVNASPGETLGAVAAGPRALVEMYSFYYGSYHRATATLEPGDVLSAEFKLPKMPVFDLTKLAADVAAGNTGQGGAMTGGDGGSMSGGGGGAPASGGGKRGGMSSMGGDGGGAGGTLGGGGGVMGGGGQQAGQQPATDPTLDLATRLGRADKVASWTPESRLFNVDVVLLDVAAGVAVQRQTSLGAQTAQSFQAVFRNEGGLVIARDPSAEQATEVYRRVSFLAKEAEQAAKAAQPKPETQRNPGSGTPSGGERTPPPPAGGSGGGGTGGG